ncbi:peptidoglycan-binding protein [Phycicoccus sp. CSK15P-2]|uniref:peptidoglycan-binding domain-containing protein n=1 Tax=Phycicoccus sp. CSK15P-2 TaxID=2807627 RepID=UPI001951B222|nr:peptidoglycan-binding protein [Phycicoccus sp. CSK15P-2]MBM6402956.1 peptidoglycan-binding protein [Phycicoccus sp. CSK15P-2]
MSLPKPESLPSWRGPVRVLGALSATVVALPLAGGSAQAASVPLPKPSRSLPSALDVAPPYQKGTRCLNESQPGPVAFAKLLNATYGSHTYGVLRKCDQEHGEGRALDWMLDARRSGDLAIGNTVTRWLAAPDSQGRQGAMARRFGINYIVWNRQIWKAWAPERGWQAYTGSSPHTDHIHLSFTWDGAYQRTSWWTGTAVVDYLTGPKSGGSAGGSTSSSPKPTAAELRPFVSVGLQRGSRGAAVAMLQRALGGIAVDGDFGPITEHAVKIYQKNHGMWQNGRVGRTVWRQLVTEAEERAGSSGSVSTPPATLTSAQLARYVGVPLSRGSRGEAVRVLQRALGGITVDGDFGPITERAVKLFQKKHGISQSGRVGRTVWRALAGQKPGSSGSGSSSSSSSSTATSPLAQYAKITLRLWSRGEAVKAVQRSIGGLVVDGSFGPKTLARVKAWQKSRGLAVDGVIDAKDWKVLIARSTSDGASSSSSKGGSSSSSSTTSSAMTTRFTALKSTTLRKGSKGSAVRTLQATIRGGVNVDSTYGTATERRVKAVQKAAGLPVTGVVDRKTWDAVERMAHPLLPYWGTVLKRGSAGKAVTALQQAMGGDVNVDGTFGTATERRVKEVQKAAKIARTGVVGTVTWKAVEAQMR